MRLLLCLLLMCLSQLHILAQQLRDKQFVLKGKITNSESAMVYLIYNINGERIKDSCKLEQENFYFKGKIKEPTWAILRGNSKLMDDTQNPNIVDFFMEPTTMTAMVQYNHFKEFILRGSKTQLEYEMLQKQYNSIDKKSDSIYEKFSRVNRQFVIDHPNSYVSSYQLWVYKTRWTLDAAKSLYAKLTPAIQHSSYGKEIKEMIDEIDNSSVGRKANEFKTVDINGNILSLSDFRGKCVLLDFWGSWCVPCRRTTPHLIDLFKMYQDKGLDVIGVAEEYDGTGAAWRAAIKKDGTDIWHHVLSGSITDKVKSVEKSQSIVKKFGVNVFPTKILVDKSGIIIGRYEGSEEAALDKKLSEIFK